MIEALRGFRYADFMRSLLILIGLALCFSVFAQDRVYKRVNPDGSVEYSDQPIEDAEVIKVPKGSTFTMPSGSTSSRSRSSSSQRDLDTAIYQSLVISSPKNDEAIRSNEGRVTALAKSTPTLQQGHSFRWTMDGRVLQQEISSPVLQMTSVDRGSHNLEVAIVDAEGKVVISSEKIVFHVQRVSAGN